jgi:hypothetical protein
MGELGVKEERFESVAARKKSSNASDVWSGRDVHIVRDVLADQERLLDTL